MHDKQIGAFKAKRINFQTVVGGVLFPSIQIYDVFQICWQWNNHIFFFKPFNKLPH